MPKSIGNVIKRTGFVASTAAVLKAVEDGGGQLPPMEDLNQVNGHLFRLSEDDGSEFKIALLPHRAMGFNDYAGWEVVKEPFSQHLVEHQFHGSHCAILWGVFTAPLILRFEIILR